MSGFDGVTMQWFRDFADFAEFVQSSAYPEVIAPDEDKFLQDCLYQLRMVYIDASAKK